MAWPAMYISSLVRQRAGCDVRWVAIEEWESFRLWGVTIPREVIRRAFERAFAVYGIVAMAAEDAQPGARAASIRAAVRLLREGNVLGIMPEGTVGATPELLPARAGVGTFLLLLAGAGARIVPAGISERDGRLCVRFGEVVELNVPKSVGKEERDEWARERVMVAIRDLLPEALWGAYRT
jgi:1-acyl-sn-glycerol-3-phosphate acyltransferase